MKAAKLFKLFGLIIFCLAAYLLYRALRWYSPEEILQSIRAISLLRLALAALFVAGSYFSLTLFDALAVRYVGAKLPYRRIALASFSALSVGHTLGLAALSSGAIRYRLYSRWGITASQVANIILFCAVTVALGLSTLGGLALLLQPEVAADLLDISPAAGFGIGAICLALNGGYLIFATFVRRPLRIKHWSVAMPPPKLALAQICVGAMNFAFVAATLHQILRSTSNADYVTVATVYVIGNVAAIVSHVPGGLGVLEAVVVYLMPDAPAIGALVVFRVLYFLVPLTIGGPLFAAWEFTTRRHPGDTPSSGL